MTNEKRLIDANELLELYNMREEHEEYAGVLSVPIPVIQQNIKDMPTVDAVEVVHGRWDLFLGGKELQCSACKATFFDEEQNGGTPYCPNCGAKMDGDGNERT